MAAYIRPVTETRLNRAAENLQAHSRMTQNLIIDPNRGLRAGRKVLLGVDFIPDAIRGSRRGFCMALRGPSDIEGMIGRLASDTKMLEGKERTCEYDGTRITSDFTRVVLVAPYFERRGAYIIPPMGIERIAAYLRGANPAVDVETIDPTLEDGASAYARLLRNKRPDILGFSSITQSLKNDIDLMLNISSRYIDAGKPLILMGNSGVMIGPEKLLGALSPLDGVVLGPGEFKLSSIISAMQREGHDSGELLGALERDADDPSVLVTRSSDMSGNICFPSAGPEQLSRLQRSVDHFFVPYEEYWEANGVPGDIAFHISAVSCPRGCLYCAAPKGEVNFLPVGEVIAMFENARRAYPGADKFVFTDDNLFSKRSYVAELLEKLRASGDWSEEQHFTAYARADSFNGEADTAFLDDLRRTGLTGIVVGAEAFSPQLEQLNKGVGAARTKESVALLGKNGFEVEMDIILLPPNSTLSDLFMTMETSIELARTGDVHLAISPRLLAFSGAPLTEKKIPGGNAAVSGRKNVAKALQQDWIRRVEIEFDRAYGLDIPHHFKLIRPVLEELLESSIESANTIFRKLHQSFGDRLGDFNTPNMLLFWAIAATAEKNAGVFRAEASGDAARIKELAEDAISSSCGIWGREIITVLRGYQDKLPQLHDGRAAR